MKNDKCTDLQAIGAFILAGGCNKTRIKKVAEMIQAARDYRWVAIYKVTKKEFVILTQTGDEPCAFPRFPLTQGLCGAALELGKTILVNDVSKDPRHLPGFHDSKSEIIVPMVNEDEEIVGMLNVDSDKKNAFDAEDRKFLERAAGLMAHCLS